MTQVILESLHRSGIPFLARLFPCRRLVVLNFHRVHDGVSDFHDGMTELTSTQFRRHIAWLANRVEFVSERDVESLKPGGRQKVMLTFDDGYRDAYEVIAPILEEAGVPATFFISPGLLDRRMLGSWDRIAYLVKKFPGKEFYFRGCRFSLAGGHHATYSKLSEWSLSSLPDQGDEFVTELAISLGLPQPPPEQQSPELLTWDQVRDLERRGFSIGCHGFSHKVLSSLSLDEQEEEILLARARLASEGIKPRSFAYPFGTPETYSWETREAVVRSGFQLVFSFSGRSTRISSMDLSRIDRVSFKSTLAKYDFLVSFPALHNIAQAWRGKQNA